MTYSDITEKLFAAGSAEPQSEALLLLEHLFGVSPAAAFAYPEQDYASPALDSAIKRRALGEPIQYIIGKAFFYNCSFKVNENCLIPRSDTEVLCEMLIKRLPRSAKILELCTGSGCIPIAVISNRPDVSCLSVELFEKTVALAKENRELNNISESKLEIIQGDALKLNSAECINKYDAIVSNPPYIPTEIVPTLSSEVLFEPKAALDGGSDGLMFYRKFLSYADMLKPDGFFAFEIGYDQAQSIQSLCRDNCLTCEIIRDYGKNDRVALIKRTIK